MGRLRAILFAALKRSWMTLILVGCILGLMMFSLREARLVSRGSFINTGAVWGIIAGMALSKTTWRVWVLALYGVMISALVSFLGSGHILPGLNLLLSLQFSESIYLMNLRSQNLFSQFSLWMPMLLAGKNIEGTLLFDLILTWCVWILNTWLILSVIRRRRPFEGVLPIAILLSVVVYNNHLDVDILLGFLFCAGALMVQMAHAARIADWEARHVNYPAIGLDWAVGGLLVVFFSAGFARLSPLVGTAEGWRSIDAFFQELRPKAAEMSDSGPSAGTWQRAEQGNKVAGVETPVLDRIGAPLPVSDATVFWVATSDPPPAAQAGTAGSVVRRRYWRSAVFTEYTGSGWKMAATEMGEFSDDVMSSPPSGRRMLSQKFELVAAHGEVLFAANMPYWASEGVKAQIIQPDGNMLLKGHANSYHVSSWVTQVTSTQLGLAEENYPEEILDVYLQLPDTVPERVHGLATQLVKNAVTPYDKAASIRDYLRMTYPYRLDAPVPPPAWDLTDYFLFEAPGGFCSYYATSMVVLLRSQGVPARVAAGFAMGEYSETRNAFRVPANAAHAWVEVYFPVYGWVEFEPTPSQPTFDYQAGEEAFSEPAEGAARWMFPRSRIMNVRISRWMLAISGLAGLLWLGMLWCRRADMRKKGGTGRVHMLYWRMRQGLAKTGIPERSSLTPDEFQVHCDQTLCERKDLKLALSHATDLYNRSSFSPRPPGEDEIRHANRLWLRAIPDRMNIWVREKLSRLVEWVSN